MDNLELYTLGERFIELINPTSTQKMISVGKWLELGPKSRVIEFGSGNGEPLAIWATNFGISGIGIELRRKCVERARNKIAERKLSKQVKFVCGDGAKYKFEKGAYDVAACIGASFIWGDFAKTVAAMKPAIKRRGRLVIGEPYWNFESVPKKYKMLEPSILTEFELVEIARANGFDIEHVVRASTDDWDNYEATNYYGLVKWLEENQKHPDRQQVIDWLHKNQDAYFKWGREHLGWAIYLLKPKSY